MLLHLIKMGIMTCSNRQSPVASSNTILAFITGGGSGYLIPPTQWKGGMEEQRTVTRKAALISGYVSINLQKGKKIALKEVLSSYADKSKFSIQKPILSLVIFESIQAGLKN